MSGSPKHRNNNLMAAHYCPICRGDGSLIRTLPAGTLRAGLERYFDPPVPGDVVLDEYTLWRCKTCLLEFVSPLQPGSDEFYNWVTSRPGYYPEDRWEWQLAIQVMRCGRQSSECPRLLEIGCGSGNFLDKAKFQAGVVAVGLDTARGAVLECLRKGLEVYPLPVERYSEDQIQRGARFDYIVSFQCLEHVRNPKEFFSAMVSLLAPHGEIFISTPYCPIAIEHMNFYPLNNPPHHLTRWNVTAFRELASAFGLRARFYMPPPQRAIVRSMVAAHVRFHGYRSTTTKRSLILTSLRHPFLVLGDFACQLSRARVDVEHIWGDRNLTSSGENPSLASTTKKKTASDEVLVRFSNRF